MVAGAGRGRTAPIMPIIRQGHPLSRRCRRPGSGMALVLVPDYHRDRIPSSVQEVVEMPQQFGSRSRIVLALVLAFLLPLPSRASGPIPPAEHDNPTSRRGYSIPLLDLAEQKHRQVVVDREQGQYLGHPTTILLEDGRTILAVYPKGHGRGAIVMKRSTDGGLTWSDHLPVPENWATSKETPTIHRVVDPRGTRRLILFSGLYPIRMSVSEDDGRTWTPLKPIGDFGGVVTMASVERLKDGVYMALFHDDGRFLRGEGKVTKFRVYQ